MVALAKPTSYLSVDMLFKGLVSSHETLRELIKDISCSDALFWCSRINLALNENDSEDVQLYFFNTLSTSKEQYWMSKILRRCKKEGKPIIVFFRGQLLELMRWVVLYCNDKPDDGITFENKNVRVNFLKCALIASDLWCFQTYGSFMHDEIEVSVATEYARPAFRRAQEAAKKSPNMFITFGRGWEFYTKYFPKHYQQFFDAFHRSTMMTFEDYMISFAAFAVHFMKPVSSPIVFNVNTISQRTFHADQIDIFLQREALHLEEFYIGLWNDINLEEVNPTAIGPMNTQILRSKSIYTTSDGRAVILDPVYFHERVLVSPIFQLNQGDKKNSNLIFSAFGEAFEDYCCSILNRMYPTNTLWNNLIIQKEYKNDKGKTVLQIDAAILRGNSAILMEMKSSFLKESAMKLDGSSFAEEVRKKYSASTDQGIEKIKGVAQLSRTIKYIVDHVTNELSSDFRNVRDIIPVLVVHDSLLDSPLTISLLRDEFQTIITREIELDTNIQKINVMPLVIMTIDDLEHLEDSTQHFHMIDLLKDYCRINENESLHNFIATSSKYSYFINHYLVNASTEILSKTREKLFHLGK